jgi:6,7-dimethyl-8-ribityllumazine synthase
MQHFNSPTPPAIDTSKWPAHLLSQDESPKPPGLDAERERNSLLKVGIVKATFNAEVTNALKNACIDELLRAGVQAQNIVLVEVPGALEIPLALQALAQIEDPEPFHALIAIGCIIRGETYHFELVANESGKGVSQISLDFHVPIANAILTVENEAQAHARQHIKGQDAASVALQMVGVLETWA